MTSLTHLFPVTLSILQLYQFFLKLQSRHEIHIILLLLYDLIREKLIYPKMRAYLLHTNMPNRFVQSKVEALMEIRFVYSNPGTKLEQECDPSSLCHWGSGWNPWDVL